MRLVHLLLVAALLGGCGGGSGSSGGSSVPPKTATVEVGTVAGAPATIIYTADFTLRLPPGVTVESNAATGELSPGVLQPADSAALAGGRYQTASSGGRARSRSSSRTPSASRPVRWRSWFARSPPVPQRPVRASRSRAFWPGMPPAPPWRGLLRSLPSRRSNGRREIPSAVTESAYATLYSQRVMDLMTTVSTGTSWCPALFPVFTSRIASTTSIPSTTWPKTA